MKQIILDESGKDEDGQYWTRIRKGPDRFTTEISVYHAVALLRACRLLRREFSDLPQRAREVEAVKEELRFLHMAWVINPEEAIVLDEFCARHDDAPTIFRAGEIGSLAELGDRIAADMRDGGAGERADDPTELDWMNKRVDVALEIASQLRRNGRL